jgi:hypothetical protein
MTKRSPVRVLRVALLLLIACSAAPAVSQTLPAAGADLSRLTVSGLSSGAYMAGQFQIAYSGLVKGAGIVAGGPYGCARTPGGEQNPFWTIVLSLNVSRAQNQCMEDGWLFSTVPEPSDLVDHAKQLVAQEDIDPLDRLAEDKVYIFSSSGDDTVERGVVDAAAAFYRLAGVPDANVSFVKRDDAAHAFLTEEGGLVCGKEGPPYLNDCDYDQAKELLQQLYGTLQPAGEVREAGFARFDQAPFLTGLPGADFDATGIAYIPADCSGQPGCTLHVVFHGCKQGLSAVGDQFVKGSAYARWAESNRIILLFPQVRSSSFNPNGCWDWWGYSGRKFLEKDAPQMVAVKRMIDRLAASP